jgi:hypothetical protein
MVIVLNEQCKGGGASATGTFAHGSICLRVWLMAFSNGRLIFGLIYLP